MSKRLNRLLDNLLSTKLWGFVVVLLIATYLAITRVLTGSEWVDVVVIFGGIMYGAREVTKNMILRRYSKTQPMVNTVEQIIEDNKEKKEEEKLPVDIKP